MMQSLSDRQTQTCCCHRYQGTRDNCRRVTEGATRSPSRHSIVTRSDELELELDADKPASDGSSSPTESVDDVSGAEDEVDAEEEAEREACHRLGDLRRVLES